MKVTITFYIYAMYCFFRSLIFRSPRARRLETYIQNQRAKGNPRDITAYLEAFEKIVASISKENRQNISELKILEVGTGQNLIIPIMFKLLGVKQVASTDIQNLVVIEIVAQCVERLINTPDFKTLADGLSVEIEDSYYETLQLFLVRRNIYDLGIEIQHDIDLTLNQDVSKISISTIDLIYSNDVLEHIPSNILREIFIVLLSFYPLAKHVHVVDLTDHFSHVIRGLHRKNFIRFSETVWNLLAGNRIMYQNRMAMHEYKIIFESLFTECEIDSIDYQLDSDLLTLGSVCSSEKSILDYSCNKLIITV
jgi:hypothetical protein